MDPDQPVLSLASLRFSDDEAEALKGQYFSASQWGGQATELKYGSAKGEKRKKLVLDFLKFLVMDPTRFKIHLTNKRYVMYAKLVDYLIVPSWEAAGIDPHEGGAATAFASMLFLAFDHTVTSYTDVFLMAFQDLVRNPTAEQQKIFVAALVSTNGRNSLSSKLNEMLVFPGAVRSRRRSCKPAW